MLNDIEDGKVCATAVMPTNGIGHGALAGILEELDVEVLICGGIGGGARMALAEAGIRLLGGVSGSADDAVAALIGGNLAYDPDTVCSHHHHEEGHDCGSHGHDCGSHNCGEDKHGCAGNC